jgi:hypothetical protein
MPKTRPRGVLWWPHHMSNTFLPESVFGVFITSELPSWFQPFTLSIRVVRELFDKIGQAGEC